MRNSALPDSSRCSFTGFSASDRERLSFCSVLPGIPAPLVRSYRELARSQKPDENAIHPNMMVLSLGDGTQLQGRSVGSSEPVCGEIVFNTGMTGYVESLTDRLF